MSKVLDVIPKVDVPTGTRGRWRVERVTVTEDDERLQRLRCAINPSAMGRYTPAGTYTGLVRVGRDGQSIHPPVMSDTPAERADHLAPVHHATGVCLVTGLGLGMVANAMLLREEVERVTVIEIDPDVIALVAPHWHERWGDRLQIVEADALGWKPPRGQKYGAVWHDIWPNICTDNLRDMVRLRMRYARRSDYVGCWCESECRAAKARGW